MRLRFTKMHGLGNDFVVFDGVRQRVELDAAQRRFIADRHFGVGCDQILLVEAASRADMDFRYRIFNADGGEVEQCGNGARCFARFVRQQGLTDKQEIHVETAAGPISLHVQEDEQVTVNMGEPRFQPSVIPFKAPAREGLYHRRVNGDDVRFGAVSMGNPHAVLRVEDVDRAPVDSLGPVLESLGDFPQRANVGFMQIVDRGHIRLRVFERGVGETLACGTGACAAVAVGRDQGLLDERVEVDLPGGRLVLSWLGEGSPVLMTWPATTVFEGTIQL